MKRLLFLLLLLPSSGCLARQVAKDGVNARQALLDMYTDQIMDNLIRAKNGYPFVQLAYRDVLIQDADNVSGGAGDTYLDSTARVSNGVRVVTGLTRSFSNSLPFTASTKRDRTMSLHADPITDKNDVYEKYLEFSTNPAYFMVSDCKPACDVHIMRKHEKLYYWVPCEAKDAFLQLSLKTTFMRGDEKPPGPDYFAVTLTQLVGVMETGVFSGYVEFDKVVPNDDGSLVVTIANGKKVRLPVKMYTKPLQVGGIPPARGQNTNRLTLIFNTVDLAITDENLRNATAKLYLSSYLPPPNPPTVDLKRVNDSLDQIRLNVLNNNNR